MKCNKCKSEEVYFSLNNINIECRCVHCDAHIKFIPKSDIKKLNMYIVQAQTAKPLF